jgi:putative FmdB family regulatory protein
MALYTFDCTACGEVFEKVNVRMVAEPKADCPSCGSVSPKRGFDLPAQTVGRELSSPKAACPPGDGPCGTFGCRRGS